MTSSKDQVKSFIQTELNKLNLPVNTNNLAIKMTTSIFHILRKSNISNNSNIQKAVHEKSSTYDLNKEVNVYVSGGVVQHADSTKDITVNIFDFDIDGCDKSELSKDPAGHLCNHYQF